MIDKGRIAESFSRAAETYDRAAHLQRQVGERLMGNLPSSLSPVFDLPVSSHSQRAVDLGCGTGYFTRHLQARYPSADVFGLDIAAGMLQFARRNSPFHIQWVGADAERLPLATQSVDLLFSSLALQWCFNLDAVFTEIRRVLRPAGTAWFTTLAPGTLHELREAWRAVDAHRHVNDFIDVEHLSQAVERAGFASVQLEQQELVIEYDDLRQLTNELKQLGAHNLNQDRPDGMTGRQRVLKLCAAYDQMRLPNGKLPATWQVVYGCLVR